MGKVSTHLDCDGPTDSLRSAFWGGLATVVVVTVVVGCFACFTATSLGLGFVGALVDFLLVTAEAVEVFLRAAGCCVCLSLFSFLTPACLLAGNTTLVTAYKSKKQAPEIHVV